MPADNVQGWRADTLALLKELNSPVYRWPGGNFVSGYNWRDGIGDRDKRPPRKNPAWKGIEHNDVGIDEFMASVREIDAEPYIAVNSGLGDETAAADEVEYAQRRQPTRRMGKLRGAERPPGALRREVVRHRQRDVRRLAARPHAAGRVREEAQRVRRGDAQSGSRRSSWSASATSARGARGCCTHCADHMNLISEHFYCAEQAGPGRRHVAQVPDADPTHRRGAPQVPAGRFRALAGKDIRIALDEWNYWYGPHVYGELGTPVLPEGRAGHRRRPARVLPQSDIVFMANYAQTVNVIGAIKTNQDGRGARDDRAGAEAVSPAVRGDAGGGDGVPQPARV